MFDAAAIVDDTTASGAGAHGGGEELGDEVEDSSFIVKYNVLLRYLRNFVQLCMQPKSINGAKIEKDVSYFD